VTGRRPASTLYPFALVQRRSTSDDFRWFDQDEGSSSASLATQNGCCVLIKSGRCTLTDHKSDLHRVLDCRFVRSGLTGLVNVMP